MATAAEVKNIIDDALSKLDLAGSLQKLKEELNNTIETKMVLLKNELKETKEDLAALKVKYEELEKNVGVDVEYSRNRECHLKFELDTLEQYQRKNSVRIFNLKEEESENTTDLAVKIANSVEVPISAKDIDISHRVKGGVHKGDPDCIIVKFLRRQGLR